nr:uncharacterized protein LOC109166032 [Ipomoea batatas]
MEMALKSKNKMVLVDGSLAIPGVTDPKYFYWDQCNTMVLSWILRAVSPTIGQGVLWINTAEGVWKDLKKRFSQQDEFRIADIRYEIYRTKQGTSSFQDNHDELNDEASLKTDIVLPSGGVIYPDNEEQVQDTIINPESHQQNQEDTNVQTESVPSVHEGEPIAESAIDPSQGGPPESGPFLLISVIMLVRILLSGEHLHILSLMFYLTTVYLRNIEHLLLML